MVGSVALPTEIDHLFPTLVRTHVERVATYGRSRRVMGGEVLVEAGDRHPHFFVVRR